MNGVRGRVIGALLLATLTGACGAPERPLTMGFKEIPSDVVLGNQTPSTAPPAGNVEGNPGEALFPLPPSVIGLPPPSFEFNPRPIRFEPPDPCPAADPLRAPAIEAPAAIEAPPPDGLYRFRNKGSFEVSGANPSRGSFPPMTERLVGLLSRSEDGSVFDFTVTEQIANVTTATTYRVVKSQQIGSAVEGAADPGLYIRRVQSFDSTGAGVSFTPVPELRLAALPLVRGARVEARGVDPTTAITMSFASTVAGKSRVDACGVPLDSWTLELTEGTVLGPRQNLQFAATYAVGTQFGGLVLRDTVAFAGTNGDVGVSRNNTATISDAPGR